MSSEHSTVHHARRGQIGYGYPIGILCAEWHVPFIPGDLNNAWTFDFPIRYLPVPGAVGADVIHGRGERYAELFVAAARQLAAEGVRAITGNCGYMAAYQKQVAASVDVPVFMSSLLQLPILLSMLGATRSLAVLVASEANLTPALLASTGLTDLDRVIVAGLEHRPHWREVIIEERGTLDEERIRDEVVATARAVIAAHPDVGAFLFECSDLPPYSAAVHRATGRPVFDWASYIRYVHDAVVPRTYHGLV